MGAVYIRENGQKVKSVYEATKMAIQHAKNNQPVVLHLDVLRRHAHSGPILETVDEFYRHENDKISDREENDCLINACLEAELEGNSRTEIDSWIEKEQGRVLKIINNVKNKITVKSLD